MSSVIVSTMRIESLNPHKNADKLELAVLRGWQCCVPKGQYKAGDLVTYIPPDSIIPDVLAEELGVAKFLSKGRVRAIKLRGEPSYGVVIAPRGPEGENIAKELGISKWEPPIKFTVGDMMPDNPLFARYTGIENLRNFPDKLVDGEEVIATEKIHGTNSRVGLVRNADGVMERIAGSKTCCRSETPNAIYWHPFAVSGVADLLKSLDDGSVVQVILYGEIYGKVQSLRYGLPNGIGYRVFDLMVNGHFLNHDRLVEVCGVFGVEVAPILYRGPYSLDKMRDLSKGASLMPGADHIREGVVVRPVAERRDPSIGRVIFKYVSDEYLCGEYDVAAAVSEAE